MTEGSFLSFLVSGNGGFAYLDTRERAGVILEAIAMPSPGSATARISP